MQESQKEHVKYKVIAYIQRLCLNKPLNFQTKITWKRNVNKVETEIVTHEDCQSVFNQLLELELNLVYNALEAKFQPKFTEFAITVIYKGKIKSGGYVKFDAAEVINSNYSNQRVQLQISQCPDPEASLEVVFSYEIMDESGRSLFNELSMLNPLGFQQDLSQIDFQEEEERNKQALEMGNAEQRISLNQIVHHDIERRYSDQNNEREEERQSQNSPFRGKEYLKINNILDKFENISRRFRHSQKESLQQDQNSTKNESLQVSYIPNQQEERLKIRVIDLERELQNRQDLICEYQKELDSNRRYITELQIKIQLLQEKQPCLQLDPSLQLKVLAESESKFKFLYEKTLSELEEMKSSVISDANFSKQNLKFTNFVEQLNQIDEVPEFNHDQENSSSQKIEELERESVEMQSKIASMSHNIAQLFNAAYDYGGAKLLDYLQSSIGLIEREN